MRPPNRPVMNRPFNPCPWQMQDQRPRFFRPPSLNRPPPPMQNFQPRNNIFGPGNGNCPRETFPFSAPPPPAPFNNPPPGPFTNPPPPVPLTTPPPPFTKPPPGFQQQPCNPQQLPQQKQNNQQYPPQQHNQQFPNQHHNNQQFPQQQHNNQQFHKQQNNNQQFQQRQNNQHQFPHQHRPNGPNQHMGRGMPNNRGQHNANGAGPGFRGRGRGGFIGFQRNNGEKKKEKIDKRELPENNAFYCDTCDRGFKTEEKYKEHVDQHQKCTYKNCPFIAAPKLVQLHMTMQHRNGLAKKIYSMESAEDIAKWREERKKNWPTAESIEAKKKLRAEKIARGEVIETKDFSKMKQGRGRGRGRFDGRGGRGRGRGRKFGRQDNDGDMDVDTSADLKEDATANNKDVITVNHKEESDSDSDSPEEVKVVRPGKDQVKDTNGKDVKEAQSKTCEKSPVKVSKSPGSTESISNDSATTASLGLLSGYGAASSDSEDSDDRCDKLNGGLTDSNNTAVEEDTLLSAEVQVELIAKLKCAAESDLFVEDYVMADDETSSSKVVQNGQDETRKRKGDLVNGDKSRSKKKKGKGQGQTPPKRKYTLLEKLLAPEIRHERNKVLQCVHYIVKNSFFGVNTSST